MNQTQTNHTRSPRSLSPSLIIAGPFLGAKVVPLDIPEPWYSIGLGPVYRIADGEWAGRVVVERPERVREIRGRNDAK